MFTKIIIDTVYNNYYWNLKIIDKSLPLLCFRIQAQRWLSLHIWADPTKHSRDWRPRIGPHKVPSHHQRSKTNPDQSGRTNLLLIALLSIKLSFPISHYLLNTTIMTSDQFYDHMYECRIKWSYKWTDTLGLILIINYYHVVFLILFISLLQVIHVSLPRSWSRNNFWRA